MTKEKRIQYYSTKTTPVFIPTPKNIDTPMHIITNLKYKENIIQQINKQKIDKGKITPEQKEEKRLNQINLK